MLRRENVSISTASFLVMHSTLLFSSMSFTSLLSDLAENSWKRGQLSSILKDKGRRHKSVLQILLSLSAIWQSNFYSCFKEFGFWMFLLQHYSEFFTWNRLDSSLLWGTYQCKLLALLELLSWQVEVDIYLLLVGETVNEWRDSQRSLHNCKNIFSLAIFSLFAFAIVFFS